MNIIFPVFLKNKAENGGGCVTDDWRASGREILNKFRQVKPNKSSTLERVLEVGLAKTWLHSLALLLARGSLMIYEEIIIP